LMDPLFFGDLSDDHVRMLFDGVVNGISSYGNSVGVPTVGGELTYLPCYEQNPLVNVVCVGVVEKDKIVLGNASYEGGIAVLLGSSTGRDGIGGVSILASAGFSDDSGDKRPSVQVGDPFEEKRLIEACLELSNEGLLKGLQDLGGAGLSCATSETAARGGTTMEVDITKVPLREEMMEPLEILISESQERMLAIVAPEDIEKVMDICRHHEVSASNIGRIYAPGPDGTGRLIVKNGLTGESVADVPAASLADGAILYDRPMRAPRQENKSVDDPDSIVPHDAGKDILAMMMDSSWVYEQYDHQLWCSTIIGPGGDAALLRLDVPRAQEAKTGHREYDDLRRSQVTSKAVALSTDSKPRLCALDPYVGATHIVAESALNVACVGARPYGLVDCLNFGNPEHEEVMWQLSRSVDGISDACRALEVPVVGGNVSLYNESRGRDIYPTPVVTTLGLRELNGNKGILTRSHLSEGGTVILLGTVDPSLGGSRWAVDLYGKMGGRAPRLDLEFHARLVKWITSLAAGEQASSATAIHDVSEGGLGVALAELAVWSKMGLSIKGIQGHAELFSESPSRVVVCTQMPDTLIQEAESVGIPAKVLGTAGGGRLIVEGLIDLELNDMVLSWSESSSRTMDIEHGGRSAV
jgi:phosphoribosylformylglycinamidine synthase